MHAPQGATHRAVSEKYPRQQSPKCSGCDATLSSQAGESLPTLLAVFGGDGANLRSTRSWDRSYDVENREATLFLRGSIRNVLLKIFGQRLAGKRRGNWLAAVSIYKGSAIATMVLTVIDRLLEREERLWWRGAR